jgi:hypothetical protein
MDTKYLPEFDGAYLEDSYFMGIVCEGLDLHLEVLFALTLDHPEYAPPKKGEQHCYRRGRLVLGRPSVLTLKPARGLSILSDPDGTLDLGSIELYRTASGAIVIMTEWFELTAEVTSLAVSLVNDVR